MSLANWLAEGADPARMGPDEVRRIQGALAVREEQAIARLETLVAEQRAMIERGAAMPSPALRRALARRHARLGDDIEEADRDLARVGKELAGLRAIRGLLREGATLAAPDDCTPLVDRLADPSVAEEAFADQLAATLRVGQVPRKRAEGRRTGPDLMDLWDRMDRGEVTSARDALRGGGGGAAD